MPIIEVMALKCATYATSQLEYLSAQVQLISFIRMKFMNPIAGRDTSTMAHGGT